MKRRFKFAKCLLIAAAIICQTVAIGLPANAWSGMKMSKLHVSGNQLVNASGQPVVLNGWFQPTGQYWTYGSSTYYLTRNGNNSHAAVLAYLKDITNTMTNTGAMYSSNHGWYMNQVRICIDKEYLGDVAAGTYSFSGLQSVTQDVVIPYIKYAATKGLYVIIDLDFSFTNGQCTTSDNLVKYKQIWGYIASQPEIKSANNVMFELINEPVNSYADGTWGCDPSDSTFIDHWKALRDFQNSIIATIRNTGADNVIWCEGLGYDQFYSACAAYPITDPLKNYGYAVHWYPAYGAVYDDQSKLQAWWDNNVASCAKAYPINITETVWFKYKSGDPAYWDLFNGTNSGFGAKTKAIFTTAGNVSIIGGFNSNLLDSGSRSSMADPTAGLKYDGDTSRNGMARFIFDWFYERAQSYPNSNISNGIVSGATYKIISVCSGKAIDVPGGQNVNGVQLQQWKDNGATAQEWIVTDIGNGEYKIKSVCASDKVIDVKDGSSSDWTAVQLYTDLGTSAQHFRIHKLGNGYYNIINVNSNKSLDVAAASTADGAKLIQYQYTENNSQQWQFIRVN